MLLTRLRAAAVHKAKAMVQVMCTKLVKRRGPNLSLRVSCCSCSISSLVLVVDRNIISTHTLMPDTSPHSHDTSTRPVGLLLAGVLGLFGFRDDEDEEGKVPLSVKRELYRGQRAHISGDYGTAEHCYHKALGMLSSTDETADSAVYLEARAVTMDKLANLYLEQGKYTEAEATFKETLRLILTATGATDGTVATEKEAIVEISLKLSKIYANQGRYDEADVGFEWCVENAQQCVEEARTENQKPLIFTPQPLPLPLSILALLGVCKEARGTFLVMSGRPKEAITVFQETKKIVTELFTVNSLQYATLLTHEATATLDLRQPDSGEKAEQLLRDSVHIMEDLNGPQVAQSIAVASYNLAMVLEMKDDTDTRIEHHLRRSISLAEAIKDETMLDDLEVYCYKLGINLINQGRVEEARTVLNKAKKIASKTGNSDLVEHIVKALTHCM